MNELELNDLSQQFLMTLFEQTNGDASVQVSMYDVGELLGMERDTASAVAQELMGRQLAEIRTLSGGIGISADGSAMVQDIMGPMATGSSESANLGDGPLLTSGGRQAVDQIVAELKSQTGSLSLDYDALGELMADIKSMENSRKRAGQPLSKKMAGYLSTFIHSKDNDEKYQAYMGYKKASMEMIQQQQFGK